jgi:hypothetical protein
MLVSQTDPFHVASPLNPIFMLGGAPEAHEVLSVLMIPDDFRGSEARTLAKEASGPMEGGMG